MPDSSLRRRLTVAALVVAVSAVLFSTPLWSVVSSYLEPALAPLQEQLHGLTVVWVDFAGGARLGRENEALRQQLATLQSQSSEIATLTQVNQELKTLASVPATPRFTALGAEVIGRLQDEAGTSYLINRGGRDGLQPGLAVAVGQASSPNVAPAGLLVGLVRNVTATSATFTLTTSSASQVLAEVQNAAHSRGLAAGEYNLGLQLQFVPQADALAVGDQVITSNLDTLVPPGLLVGSVTAVAQHENDFFVTATLTPPEGLEQFRFVRVLVPNSP